MPLSSKFLRSELPSVEGRREKLTTVRWNRPKDPLRMLGEFLLQRSKELEEAK